MDARLLLLLVLLGVILQQEAVADGSPVKKKDGDKPIDSKEKHSDSKKGDSKNDNLEKEESNSKPDNKPKQEGKKKNDDKPNKSANGKEGEDKVKDNSKKDKDNKEKNTEEYKDNKHEKDNKETDNIQEKDKKDKEKKPNKNKQGKDNKHEKSSKKKDNSEEKNKKAKEKKPKKDKKGKDNKHEKSSKETDNSEEKNKKEKEKKPKKNEKGKDNKHEEGNTETDNSHEDKNSSHEKSKEDSDESHETSKEDKPEEHENSKESKEKSDEVVINKPNFNIRSELDFLDLDRMNMDQKGMTYYNLKCQPGRTVIKISKKKPNKLSKDSRESEEEKDKEEGEAEEEEEEGETRRTHMNRQPKDETCTVCVCSAEGKDEYCSKRPARNVNECLRMEMLEKNIKKQKLYNHDSILSYRIRRDYIWHDDEIPYSGDLKCQRGHSYYSNSETAATIDTIASYSSVESYLDFENTHICFFCACSARGTESRCIKRDRWFCDYYRNVRVDHNGRDRYRWLFKEDRPAYFRQLSYRVRRTMDTGIFDLIESGGDTLCCDHPNGHRRNLHKRVRERIVNLRKKIPKENLMSNAKAGDYVDFIVNND